MTKNNIQTSLYNLTEAYALVAEATRADLPDIWKKAVSIYNGNEVQAVEFLTTHHQMLGGIKPLSKAIESDKGRQEVLDLMNRIEHSFCV